MSISTLSKIGEETLRVDDFRFYGRVCLIFGIILLAIGIVLPIATIDRYYLNLNNTYVHVPINAIIPYLNEGIALGLVGVVMIIVSQILYREWRLRIAETEAKVTSTPSSQKPS